MKICVPIKVNKIAVVISQLKKANKEADVVEIWFDEITDFNEDGEQQINLNSKKPLLYKVSKINFEKIEHLLTTIKKIEYLDLDISTDKNILKKIKEKFPQIQLIISHHDFKKTPSQKELISLAEIMFTKGADIAKIATKASKIEDSINMLSLLSQLTKNGQKAICLCMGKPGRLTRTTGHLVGNYLMYAPMREAHKTASGQIPIKELKKSLNQITKLKCLSK
jgi:3-dehydroquinate dehydratase-1